MSIQVQSKVNTFRNKDLAVILYVNTGSVEVNTFRNKNITVILYVNTGSV